jgi:FAD dependent oxidoreductase TIGR03364
LDELAVLEEFCQLGTHQACLLTPAEVVHRTALANPHGLQGGMLSSTELRVDPRTAVHRIAAWLAEQHQVTCLFETLITGVDEGRIQAADGRTWRAERTIVCSGSDLQTLFPDVLKRTGLRLCKLQMLRTVAQATPKNPTAHLASGLTLRHYTSFESCTSLAVLKRRIAEETPELDRFGIHVMASQLRTGEVILGDSHEYGDGVSPFDKSEIDELIVRELRKVIQLDDWSIGQRWHGVYARHPLLPVFEAELAGGVFVFVGTGGAGMTMSFALAERAWKRWSGDVQ